MKTIKVITPVGEFTRKTSTDYTHAVVRKSERARGVYEKFLTTGEKSGSGVDARWIKDRGFAVTYHTSERAARNAANQKYGWDSKAEVIGIYEVAV
jgi:methylmalonyl-CoA mutase cobalamin-binding subunit